MISLLFLLLIVVLFVLILTTESTSPDSRNLPADLGLVTWLTSGNWPAKVGGGLLLLGIGALLRYSLIHLDIPGEVKLGSGFVLSAILAAAAFALKKHSERRAVYLALAGTSAGVAYLSAYSAYGFFHFINDVNSLALLALVAMLTGIFALSANSVSIAILAMAGAYIAPTFALETPGPLPVYGYYFAVSSLSLVMVTLRGWRPLIHLSFFFTLAGALFFGWTARFYQPEYYAVMQPMLLALVAVHLAMPLVERKHLPARWLSRFDMGYFLTLPIVAAVLAVLISPTVRNEGTIGLTLLGLLWAGAALILSLLKRDETLRHALVAVLLLAAAVVCRIEDIPWILGGLCLSVGAFILAPRLGWSETTEKYLSGFVLLFGFLHVVVSVVEAPPATAFLNDVFAARLLATVMLAMSGWIAARRNHPFTTLLVTMAAGWGGLATIIEIQRLHLDYIPQVIYALLLVSTLVLAIVSRRTNLPAIVVIVLTVVLAGCGWWSAHTASSLVIISALILTPTALFCLVLARLSLGEDDDPGSVTTLALLPLILLPWAHATVAVSPHPSFFMGAIIIVGVASLSLIAARLWMPQNQQLLENILPLHFLLIAAGLVGTTTLHIERSALAIIFESLSLAYLIGFSTLREKNDQQDEPVFGVITVIGTTLLLQAMLLRVLGPDRVMTVFDLSRMQLPAVVSLLWASLGAGLAWWGVKSVSRSIWSAGAVLLVVVAVKLVWFDFGSLGQLGNIIALIAAGLLFLAVAWLAPIPPKVVPQRKSRPTPVAAHCPESGECEHPVPLTGAATGAVLNKPLSPDSRMTDRPVLPRPASLIKPQVPPTNNSAWLVFVLIGVSLFLFMTYFNRSNAEKKKHRESITHYQNMQDQQTTAAAEPDETTIPPEVVAPSMPMNVNTPPQLIKIKDAASTFIERLPPTYILYAGGAYSGRVLGFPIDQSGHEATQFDVFVHQPGEKVVLALGAYEPSVWNISWSSDTQISGVFISGYHRQAVAGLPPEVPVLQGTYENRAPCGYFYLDRNNPQQADTVIRKLFGRSAESYFVATAGRIDLGLSPSSGTQFVQSSQTTVDSYRDQNIPLAGKAGLNQLVQEGKLRRATNQDITSWREARRKAKNLPEINVIGAASADERLDGNIGNAYVVLQPISFPSGLYGANSAIFILQEGVPFPEGEPGHSTIWDMNNLNCVGLSCR